MIPIYYKKADCMIEERRALATSDDDQADQALTNTSDGVLILGSKMSVAIEILLDILNSIFD